MTPLAGIEATRPEPIYRVGTLEVDLAGYAAADQMAAWLRRG